MKKIVVALFTCMTLGSLGITALETSLPISQEPVPSKEVSVEKHCERGPRGHRGHRGHHGKQGKIGPQGPAGTSAAGEFGEAYLIPNWTDTPPPRYIVPTLYAPVQFTTAGPLSSGVTYNSSTWTFTVNTAGTYTIEFDVKATFTSKEIDISEVGPLSAKVVIGVDDQAPTIVPMLRASTGYYAEAANQITQFIPAGTTIQLQAQCPNTNQIPVLYGISGDLQEATYICIEKVGD